jgi:hypothetical protein
MNRGRTGQGEHEQRYKYRKREKTQKAKKIKQSVEEQVKEKEYPADLVVVAAYSLT